MTKINDMRSYKKGGSTIILGIKKILDPGDYEGTRIDNFIVSDGTEELKLGIFGPKVAYSQGDMIKLTKTYIKKSKDGQYENISIMRGGTNECVGVDSQVFADNMQVFAEIAFVPKAKNDGGFGGNILVKAAPTQQKTYQQQMLPDHPPYVNMDMEGLIAAFAKETNGAARGHIDKMIQHQQLIGITKMHISAITEPTIVLKRANDLKEEQIKLLNEDEYEEEEVQ